MSTLMGVFGCVESHAQPVIAVQSAVSWKPSYSGGPGGLQLIVFAVAPRLMFVPVYLIVIVCGWPFLRLAGVGKLKPCTPLPYPASSRSWRNWLAGAVAVNKGLLSMWTFMVVVGFGLCRSHAELVVVVPSPRKRSHGHLQLHS